MSSAALDALHLAHDIVAAEHTHGIHAAAEIVRSAIDAAEARQREVALDYDFCGDPNRPEWSDGYSEALADLEARLRALAHSRTDPLHAQAVAAGYAGVAEWVAAKDAEIARLKQPQWFYADGWEEHCFDDPNEVIDFVDPGADCVVEISTARPTPTIWAAVRRNLDEDADEPWTFTEHASEEEARQALAGDV